MDLYKLSQYMEAFILDTLYTEEELVRFYHDININEVNYAGMCVFVRVFMCIY